MTFQSGDKVITTMTLTFPSALNWFAREDQSKTVQAGTAGAVERNAVVAEDGLLLGVYVRFEQFMLSVIVPVAALMIEPEIVIPDVLDPYTVRIEAVAAARDFIGKGGEILAALATNLRSADPLSLMYSTSNALDEYAERAFDLVDDLNGQFDTELATLITEDDLEDNSTGCGLPGCIFCSR